VLRRKRVNNDIEREIAIAFITSEKFIREVGVIYKPEFIESPAVKTIIDWCITYYVHYEKAPDTNIQTIFKTNQRKGKVDLSIVEDLLEEISDEHSTSSKDLNIPYLIDRTEKRFRQIALKNLCGDIESCLESEETDEAEAYLSSFSRLQRPSGDGVNPFTCREAIYNAFDDENTYLMKAPGSLGEMINDLLARDALVALMGPEKRGKTFMLQEFAMWGLKARLNTVFFAVGDMSQDQMIRRFHVRLCSKSDRRKYCGEISVPILDCVHNQNNSCKLVHRTCSTSCMGTKDVPAQHILRKAFDEGQHGDSYSPCTYCHTSTKFAYKYKPAVWYRTRPKVEPLSWKDGYKMGNRFARHVRREMKLSVHPNRTINVQGIKNQLTIWEETEGFVPELIIIDYADILAPENAGVEFRHQQNETWQALRALSQEKHSLVVTATQSDAKSYDTRSIRTKNFSEDKRKFAHATAILTLNQEDQEKLAGIMRIGLLLAREDDFSVQSEVVLLQQLKMGRPYLKSFHLHKSN